MARDVTVTIAGTRELAAVLKSIPEKEAAKAIRKGTRAGQKAIARVAKRRAPKRTGAMARAVKVRAMKRRRHRFGHVVVVGDKTFTGDTFYGGFQEFGWHVGKRRTSNGTGQRRFIEGEHFMERAARDKGKTAGIIATAIIRSELGINLRTSTLVAKALKTRLKR